MASSARRIRTVMLWNGGRRESVPKQPTTSKDSDYYDEKFLICWYIHTPLVVPTASFKSFSFEPTPRVITRSDAKASHAYKFTLRRRADFYSSSSSLPSHRLPSIHQQPQQYLDRPQAHHLFDSEVFKMSDPTVSRSLSLKHIQLKIAAASCPHRHRSGWRSHPSSLPGDRHE